MEGDAQNKYRKVEEDLSASTELRTIRTGYLFKTKTI